MHSSIMHTARSSSHLLEGGLSACWDTQTPLPWVWAWKPPSPRCGPGEPPCQTLQPPLQVWAWKPPRQTPQAPPHPGVGLEIPPVNRILDTHF